MQWLRWTCSLTGWINYHQLQHTIDRLIINWLEEKGPTLIMGLSPIDYTAVQASGMKHRWETQSVMLQLRGCNGPLSPGRPLTFLGESGEDRGETLGRRPRERYHCSTKKREGLFMGFTVWGRETQHGGNGYNFKIKQKGWRMPQKCIRVDSCFKIKFTSRWQRNTVAVEKHLGYLHNYGQRPDL